MGGGAGGAGAGAGAGALGEPVAGTSEGGGAGLATGGPTHDGGGGNLFAGMATSAPTSAPTSSAPVAPGGLSGAAGTDPFAQLGLAGMATLGGGGAGEELRPPHAQGASSDPFADLARVGGGGF